MGLIIWGFLHISGGSLIINWDVLYKLMLLPINSHVFSFDQFVHIVGFCVATLVMYQILKPHIKTDKWVAVSIVVVKDGLGVGALNEIVEFIAVLILLQIDVGGYMNISIDLIADLIGVLIALVIIRLNSGK